MPTSPITLTANGIALDTSTDALGPIRDSNDILTDVDAIRSRMADDGYLLFRRLIAPAVVLEARREILLKYATVGEIDSINHPVMDAIQSDHSSIDKVNLRAFTESVRSGLAYENVILDPSLMSLLEISSRRCRTAF